MLSERALVAGLAILREEGLVPEGQEVPLSRLLAALAQRRREAACGVDTPTVRPAKRQWFLGPYRGRMQKIARAD